MATNFTPADAAVLSTRTLLYTCPAATQSVVFSGTIANVDDTNMLDHTITVEVQKVDTSYVANLNAIPIPYGSSLTLPKIALSAGEKLYLKADAASVLVARASIVEKT